MNVCIVGGGLSGLLLSRLLNESGKFVVTVLEQSKKFQETSVRPIGMVMNHRTEEVLGDVFGRGKIGVPLHGRLFHQGMGSHFVPFGTTMTGVSRYDILENLVGQDVVFDVSDLNFDEKNRVVNYVQSGEQKRVKTDLLVGCDGRHSTVRKEYFADAVEKTIDHWWKSVPLKNVEERLSKEAIHIYPLADGFLHLMSTSEEKEERIATLVLKSDVLKTVKADYFESLRNDVDIDELMVRLSECVLGKFSTVHCKQYHKNDNIVIIGDAAHATVVFAGQGMNMAFDDSILLAKLLKENDVGKAISDFSRMRVAEMEAMHSIGLLAYRFLFDPFPSWRIEYQQRMSRLFGNSIYPKSLYSMINVRDQISFQETLNKIENQNKWYNIGRIA